jgi:hypothetical protein
MCNLIQETLQIGPLAARIGLTGESGLSDSSAPIRDGDLCVSQYRS